MNLNCSVVGRRALVTGASSGLGAHFAEVLANAGVEALVVTARRMDRLADVAARCRAVGGVRVLETVLDVSQELSIAAAFRVIAAELGGLDLLVNNAGVAKAAPALDVSVQDFDQIVGVNLRGAWLCAVAAAQLMKQGSGGDIVNISSILGLRIAKGLGPYAVSKAGVVQMTKALAVEWARYDIRVNALAPGYFETELNDTFFDSDAGKAMTQRIPMRRLGRLTDLDPPFLLLASGASRYLTAAILTVDGGHHCNSL